MYIFVYGVNRMYLGYQWRATREGFHLDIMYLEQITPKFDRDIRDTCISRHQNLIFIYIYIYESLCDR